MVWRRLLLLISEEACAGRTRTGHGNQDLVVTGELVERGNDLNGIRREKRR